MDEHATFDRLEGRALSEARKVQMRLHEDKRIDVSDVLAALLRWREFIDDYEMDETKKQKLRTGILTAEQTYISYAKGQVSNQTLRTLSAHMLEKNFSL
jgi:hypothetical protein